MEDEYLQASPKPFLHLKVYLPKTKICKTSLLLKLCNELKLLVPLLCINGCFTLADAQTVLPGSGELKKLTVEELMNMEVISVTKNPEKLTEVPSAIQVITGEDIRRSTYSSLSEALRLASNLQVAKPSSHAWAITSRGFNAAPLSTNTLANKLLVLIDGRTIYTPLFGGVFWDAQNTMLNDIDRIEVVSGPGGSLWGANAVNGVINVISKSSKETQGLYASASVGTFVNDNMVVRYGGEIGKNLYYRVYAQHTDQGSMKMKDGSSAEDGWSMTQGGFRMDYQPTNKNYFSLIGNLYGGNDKDQSSQAVTNMNGQNILGKWVHDFSNRSKLTINAYFDRTWRHIPFSGFMDRMNTYDLDLQHQLKIGKTHNLLWGLGYRLMDDNVNNSPSLTLTPANKTLNLATAFIQDKMDIIPHKLELTLGSKILHNDYSGYEFQPSVRAAWIISPKNTLWTAISRAVRTPSRFETEEKTASISTPDGNFNSEIVNAYELGYRIRPTEKMSFSFAAFYNDYDQLRSINNNPNPPTTYIFANDQIAKTWGLELSGNILASNWLRLRCGATYIDKQFTSVSPNVLPVSSTVEALDPKYQVMVQSIMDISRHLQFDFTGRYASDIESQLPVTIAVNAYATFDIRLAWESKKWTFGIKGQNLASGDHTEFGSRQVPRHYSAQISWHF